MCPHLSSVCIGGDGHLKNSVHLKVVWVKHVLIRLGRGGEGGEEREGGRGGGGGGGRGEGEGRERERREKRRLH